MTRNIYFVVITSLIFLSCSQNNNSRAMKDLSEEGGVFVADLSQLKDFYTITSKTVDSGFYRKALERHIWYHNNIMNYDTNQNALRLFYMLAEWRKLGRIYPPAKDSLIKIRDEKTRAITETTPSRFLFQDVAAINYNLGEGEKNVSIFRFLSENYPGLAKECFQMAQSDLFNAKEYALIRPYLSNPLDLYEKEEVLYFDMINLSKKYPLKLKDSAAILKYQADNSQLYLRSFVNRVLQIIDYCKTINDISTAKKIQEKALTIVPDKKISEAI